MFLVEQDFSNDLERRMCEAAPSRRKVDDGRAEVGSDVEVERYPRLVLTSTNHHPPAPRHGLADRRGPTRGSSLASCSCSIFQASLSPLSPVTKLDTGPYIGFSFNLLFFGHTESTLSKAGGRIKMHGSVHPFDGCAEGCL